MFKTVAIVCTVLCVGLSSVFGGEFVSKEFIKLRKVGDLAGMKSYIETNNQCSSKNVADHCGLILAKATVMTLVDKTITKENVFQVLTNLVDQTKLTANEKITAKAHVYAAFPTYVNNSITLTSFKDQVCQFATDEVISIVRQNHIRKRDVYVLYMVRPDFDKNVVNAADFAPYQVFWRALTFSSVSDENKIIVVDKLTANVNTVIKAPYQLDGVIKRIKTLNNPKFDEPVIRLLTVLNRHCYPKIQDNDQWKKSVVSLQLVMKSYGL